MAADDRGRSRTAHPPPHRDPVRDAADALLEAARSVGDHEAAATVADVRARLEQLTLVVAVVGEFKRGKSTLINALIGQDVLPTGVLPLTTVPTIIESGPRGCEVHFVDGRTETHGIEEVAGFVSEEANPGNRLGVDHVVVRLHVPLLDAGVRLVDTPGVGSTLTHGSAITASYLPRIDAAVLVTSADPPISAGETEFLSDVLEYAVELFVVLNKIDYLGPEDLRRTIAFTEREVAARVPSWSGPVHPLCASRGPDDDDVSTFRSRLRSFIAQRRGQVVSASAARNLLRAARSMELSIDIELSALAGTVDDIEARVGALEHEIERLGRGAAGDDALLRGAIDNGLREFDRYVDGSVADLEEEVVAATRARIAELDHPPPGELLQILRTERPRLLVERLGPAVAAATERAIGAYRGTLGEVVERVHRRLEAFTRQAAQALGVQPPPFDPPDIDTSVEPVNFTYVRPLTLSDEAIRAGWRMLGARGRRRAEDKAVEEAAEEVGMYLGRLRGQIDARLRDTTRRIQASLRRLEAELADSMTSAIRRGSALAGHARSEQAERRRVLEDARAAVAAVVRAIDHPAR